MQNHSGISKYLLAFALTMPASSFATIEEDVSDLQGRMTTAETEISNNAADITNNSADVADHETRLYPLETLEIDPAASLVYLRTDCGIQDDCFEDMASLLNWIQNTHTPANSALLVEAGPGEFYDFRCEGFHNVTLRGAGRDKTVLAYQSNYRGSALSAANCSGLSFHDITVDGKESVGVWWVDSDKGTFRNVHVVNSSMGLFDYCVSSTTQPVAKWFSSTFGPSSGTTVKIGCGQHWFFGSEIEQVWTTLSGGGMGGPDTVRIETFGGMGDARFYGSSIRTTVDSSVSGGKMTSVYNYGLFHAHGGEIVTDAGNGSGNIRVTAVKSHDAWKTHIVETSFGLKAAGTETATRILAVGSATSVDVIHAPFQWPSKPTPPAILSVDGFDTFVETDCDSDGLCDSAGSLTHLMIYNATACGSTDPWYNSSTNRCRNVGP